MFTAANALPLAGVAYYLKSSIEDRQLELERLSDLVSLPAADAVSRMESICKSCDNSILIHGDSISPVLPHLPESESLLLSSDEVVDNIDKTIPGTAALIDSVTATRDSSTRVPFNFIHLGVSSASSIGKALLSDRNRRMTIVYNGGSINDISVIVTGTATIIEDDRLKTYYWRDRWGSYIGKESYILVKITPAELQVKSLSGGEAMFDGMKLSRSDKVWNRV